MVSLYERRRDGRCMSLMMISEWGRGSPILPHSPPLVIPGNRNEGAHVCNHLNDTINTTVTSTTSYNSSFYELEITELSHSPTDTRHSVWSFTPTHSPLLGRKSPPGPPTHSASPPSPPTHSACPPTHSPVLGRKGSPAPPTYSPVLRRKSCPDPSPRSLHTPDQGMMTSTPASTRNHIHESSKMVFEGLLGEDFHNMHATDDRRQMVIGELIDTEQRYINNLEILLNVYLPALEDVVAPRDLRLLFPAQLEPLLERHRELLGRMEEREESPFAGTIGNIFNQLCNGGNSEFVNTYSAYMNEFRVAMQTLAKYEQSSLEFKQLLLKCQHTCDCKGLSLSAYLLTPIQRLPRYELLLKELLKHTPLNHPDNYYLGEAVENLRDELFRLNHSIKSCQLACSVTRIRNGRKASFRRFSRSVRKTTRSLSQMKRHVSAANIHDYSSDSGPNSSPLPHLRHHGSISSIYQSDVNLMEAEEGEEEEEEVIGTGERLRRSARAASCSDLLLDLEPHRAKLQLKFHKMEPLPSVPSLPSLPPTPQPSPQPSSPGGSSTVPVSSEESGPQPRSRVSVYSTASSTSGIASLGQSQLDLASMLTPTDSNTDSMHATPTPSDDVPVKTNTSARRNSLWNGALRLFRRKTSPFNRCNSSPSIKVEISSPMDFRHIQHVPHFMGTPGSRTSAYL